MSFQDFHGFDQIEQQLKDERLIAVPRPPPTTINFNNGSGTEYNNTLIETELLTPQEKIYNIFKTTQHGAITYNTHPAVQLVVEWMKRNLTEPRWLDANLNTVIFGNMANTPTAFTVGGIEHDRLKGGGVALLIKSIYNSCRQYDDNIQLERCNNTIADLNAYIWNNKVSFLITWYRHNYGMWPTDNTLYVNAYKAALCSKAYKSLKQMQAGTGTWLDANLEMFHHFVKLAACGATDDQINDVYHELTTSIPILDGSTFGEIYTNHWRTYEGWVSQGYLDFGDIGATNLDKWHTYPNISKRQPEHSYLAENVILHYSYWKSAPSSSCFSASAQVIMASGETKAISDIKPGDRILSRRLGAERAGRSRTVAFVSKPERAGRPLYELQSFPGIQFTETHPLLAATTSERTFVSLPKLLFVSPNLAASLNPTWQSFETTAIDSRVLITHDASKGQDQELLYDLIFEPLGPEAESDSFGTAPIYTLKASNGQRLDVLSEAPLIEWFTLEMIFVGNVVKAVLGSGSSVEKFIGDINQNRGSLQNLLRGLSGTDISRNSVNAITDVTLQSLLFLNGDDNNSQDISGFIERLIMRLGRTIGNQISMGWLNPSQLPASEAHLVDVVFLQVLRRLNDFGGDKGPMANDWTASIDIENCQMPRLRLQGHRQGHNTIVLHEGILLPPLQHDQAAQHKDANYSIHIELKDYTGENTLVGGGVLRYNSQILFSMGDLAAEGSGNHAVLEVELRKVHRESFEKRHNWGLKDQMNYAAILGYAFGLELEQLL
ncbi:hypothetical protein Focb16_v013116 [Fusarium oxysporum f. sp. cubense]|uniref:Hedgehog protein Hint domain-containing protein n=1 Tax=Fusarium oxysporum f. sp. cubense TaxID=61366 RepID=A0A559KQY9_FUSOC|nr:hypothetical protein Focb16_v013116 [Fusarium oxysporum f. sp. cubense]